MAQTSLILYLNQSADLREAKIHAKSNKVQKLAGVKFPKEEWAGYCRCCKFPADGQKFPLKACDELRELGLAFPLFFHSLRFLIWVMVVVFFVTGLPNLVQNISSNRQSEYGPRSAIAQMSIGGNGKGDSDLQEWCVIQNFAALLLLCVLYVFAVLQLKRRKAKLTCESYSIENFTVVVSNLLEVGSIQEELKRHIQEKMNSDLNVVSVFVPRARDAVGAERPPSINQHSFERPTSTFIDALSSSDQYESLLLMSSKPNCGFVTFDTIAQKKAFTAAWKPSLLKKLISKCRKLVNEKLILNGRVIVVESATEPTDVQWSNLDVTETRRRLLLSLMYFLLLAILISSYFLLSVLADWQRTLYTEYDKPKDQGKLSTWMRIRAFIGISSIVSAAIIYVFNLFLDISIRYMSQLELHRTYTIEKLSAAMKLTTVFSLNSLLFPLLVNLNSNSWYTPNGLATNIFYVALSSAFVRPLLKLTSPLELVRYLVIKLTQRRMQRNRVNQAQANKAFMFREVDIAYWYADLYVKFMLVAAYSPLIPVVIPIMIAGCTLEYWIAKVVLLRKATRPKRLSYHIAFRMIMFLKVSIVLYGFSSLVFFSNEKAETGNVAWAALATGIAFTLVRCKWFKGLYPAKERDQNVHFDDIQSHWKTVLSTQDYKREFTSQCLSVSSNLLTPTPSSSIGSQQRWSPTVARVLRRSGLGYPATVPPDSEWHDYYLRPEDDRELTSENPLINE